MTNVLKNDDSFKIVAYVIITRKARNKWWHSYNGAHAERVSYALIRRRVIPKIFLYQHFDILEHLKDHVASKYAH